MRLALLVVLVLDLSSLSSCIGPPHSKPAELLATPTHWETKIIVGEVSDWLQSFQDPTLTAIVQEALAMNDDLRATAARIEAARASRFLPIIIVALTNLAGFFPLLFETSEQAKFLVPVSLSLASGLIFGLIGALILVHSARNTQWVCSGRSWVPSPLAGEGQDGG
jgi:hypothetical protein